MANTKLYAVEVRNVIEFSNEDGSKVLSVLGQCYGHYDAVDPSLLHQFATPTLVRFKIGTALKGGQPVNEKLAQTVIKGARMVCPAAQINRDPVTNINGDDVRSFAGLTVSGIEVVNAREAFTEEVADTKVSRTMLGAEVSLLDRLARFTKNALPF